MKVAILGATGLVGRRMLALLADRPWADPDPVLLGSERSAGVPLDFRGRSIPGKAVTPEDFAGVEIALFSAGAAAGRRFGPVAAAAGAWVIDNSSAFRMDPDVPLVVPEINGGLLAAAGRGAGGIIANPNCSTIQIAMAAAPLERVFGLAEVHVTTLQAVSGAGQRALDEWRRQEDGVPPCDPPLFARPMAHNVLPCIGGPAADGSFEEEAKVVRELRKILGRGSDLGVTCTAVRVPVQDGHSAAVRFVLQREADLEAAIAALRGFPGLVVAEGPLDFATPREVAGGNAVHVGRLRRDPGQPRALLAWVVADNLLKGAAWNALQIADLLAGHAGAGADR
ncbi:MAG: aspartate-semialdehyde dehydrogenase [Candidatus Krumholzibacteriia bacterium]